MGGEQDKWDQRYRASTAEPHAAQVLSENLHLLPQHGTALDLACGLGGKRILISKHGLEVEAWDISPVAIDKLRTLADSLPIQARVVDITASSLPANQFDVIVVSHYLDRELANVIIAALKPNGLLFYQTFNQHQCGRGPGKPAYRLQDNELLRLFKGLAVRYYREDPSCDIAQLIAQKSRAD